MAGYSGHWSNGVYTGPNAEGVSAAAFGGSEVLGGVPLDFDPFADEAPIAPAGPATVLSAREKARRAEQEARDRRTAELAIERELRNSTEAGVLGVTVRTFAGQRGKERVLLSYGGQTWSFGADGQVKTSKRGGKQSLDELAESLFPGVARGVAEGRLHGLVERELTKLKNRRTPVRRAA